MDSLSPVERSELMARIRGKDTTPEMMVRRALHRLGYRYRLHVAGLPGRPDLVFPARRKVIFVNGCFWHRHDDPSCPKSRLPKSRIDFWTAKFETNVARDRRNIAKLEELGWQALVVWECQLRRMPDALKDITGFLDALVAPA